MGDTTSKNIIINNTASGALTDAVTGGFGAITGGFNGSGTLSGIAAGDSGALSVSVSTASAGVETGTAALSLHSHDADLSDLDLTTAPVTLTATVNNYAVATLQGAHLVSAGHYTLDLGMLNQGQTASASLLSVLNDVAAPGDTLNGTFTVLDQDGGFVNTGFDNFSGLAPGQSAAIGGVSLDTSNTGSFSETIDFHPTGTNASGYAGALPDELITVMGQVGSGSTTSPTITHITPDQGSNLGNVTITINGTNFAAGEQAEVIGPDGTVRAAAQVQVANSGEIWATFNLQGLATGTYSVRVTQGAQSATDAGAFTVDSGPVGQVSVNLILPTATTLGESGTATVQYANTGNTDVATPIFSLDSTEALLTDLAGSEGAGSVLVLGTNAEGPPGILQPGATGSVSITYAPVAPVAGENVAVSAGLVTPGSPIDWTSLEDALRPATVDPTDWNNVFTEFVARVGTTTDSLATALSHDAAELSQAGQPTTDVATLLQYELFQASGALAGTFLTQATDIASTSSSLSLSLGRAYDGTLLARDATGAYGHGWTSTYEASAVTDASGTIYVQMPGILHVFTLQADGSYVAQSGDQSTLTQTGGLYRMQDASGAVEQFRADGKLGSVTDTNGNTVALAYDGAGVLLNVTSLTTGESITFTSNAAGLITGATDSDGRAVSYTYDANGNLVSTSGPGGVTSYAYVAATGSVQDNALTTITNPDGTHAYFTYDAQGRLATQSGDGGTGSQTYSYSNPGEVVVTDALGNATTLLYGANGTVAEVKDALGSVTTLTSNAAGALTGATTAGNITYHYSYNSAGNLTSFSDPLGGTAYAEYAPGTQNLTDFIDQRGAQTHYSYDAAGNVTGITYQDGSGSSYSYNAAGLLTSSTDADGNTIQYGYDAAGDLTSKNFADGTSDTYAYDAHGYLIAATAQDGGTTSYGYDAADRLTSVTNPQGQVESYTYNARGELASRTLPNGSVTQYGYDAYGRLAELQDGSGNLLDKYTYNVVGELIRMDTGNGASTTYQYDANGDVTEISNSNADGNVASRFDYTYDARGQVVQDATSDGTWNYSYDAYGELTHAVLQSTNPAVDSQNITYVYDAAGNRISQTINGVATNYTTNSLNQYTNVGGTIYTYDADGNTTSETDSSGTTTFTYNQEGQLTSKIGPGGTFQYVYDALGNLVSETQNGIINDYVNDPLSLSVSGQNLPSIAQVDDASDSSEATYDYGLGLAAVVSGSGATSYFETDSSGNVTGLSGPDGDQISTYAYDPFGTLLYANGSDTNPFTFNGKFGVASENGGLASMRARSYDPTIGRFLSTDPLGLLGSGNGYEFSLNDPLLLNDPTGLIAVTTVLKGAAGVYGGYLTADAGVGLLATAAVGGVLLGAPVLLVGATALLGGAALIYGVYQAGEGIKDIAQGLVDGGWTIQSGNLKDGLGAATALIPSVSKIPILDDFINNHFFAGPIAEEIGDIIQDKLQELGVDAISEKLTELSKGVKRAIASLFPDPHLTTFDGLYYSFQTAGEFVLTRDTNGGTFQVQGRLSAPVGARSYSVITELGIEVGADRVTIDATRASPLWVDGAPVTFTAGTIALAGGQIVKTADGYQVVLNTGETVTASLSTGGETVGPATTSVSGIRTTISLGDAATPGGVQGLLGNDNGDPTKDLTLADGTVLPSNMPLSLLYGAYADAWRVTQATSLLDYGPGETTDTYTDRNYPGTPLTLASFPQAAIDAATARAMQAGITDPGLLQAAAYDYLVTGDPSYFTVESNIQQQGISTTAQTDFIAPAATAAMVGLLAAQTTETETSNGSTTANFQIYRSGDTTGPITVTYTVVAPDEGYVGADSFGGTLPSGTVTLAAGQATAELSITLAQDIGAVPSKTLEVQISAASPNQVIGATALTTIINAAPVAGTPPVFAVELTNDLAITPTISGNTWAFDLGQARQGVSGATPITLAVLNMGPSGADNLGGTITATADSILTTAVSDSFTNIGSGAIRDVATLTLNALASAATTETLTVNLTDTNGTGYTAPLPGETVTISATPVALAQPTLSLPALQIIHVGDSGILSLAISNAPGLVEILRASVTATAGGITAQPGSFAIAAGDTLAVPLTIATTTAGTISGTVALSFQSDGAGTDGAAPIGIGSQTPVITATVDNYASLGLAASVGHLSFDGTEYVLDLGTVQRGTTSLSTTISVSNAATGPADLLSGTVTLDSADGLSDHGSGTYANLASGASADAETITLATDTAGTFSQTLLLHSTGTNASGYSGTLADQRLLVTGIVSASGSIPPDVVVGTGPDEIALSLSEDAYLGDAQFTVSVDGQQVGGPLTTTASHQAGEHQLFTLEGSFGAGPHTLTIDYLNDLYAGTQSTDRNLYVNSIATDGVVKQTQSVLYSAGPAAFVSPVLSDENSPGTISLAVAEDAFDGNAQFTVSVDGQQSGEVYTATASRSAGQSQTVVLDGTFGAGPHFIGVNFLNDNYAGSPSTDRNLYVESITAGNVTINPQATLFAQGTKSFITPAQPVPTRVGPSDLNQISLSLSEDAYQGDVQFTLAVDGQTLGGVQTVAASHAAGDDQVFTLDGDFSAGPHTVSVNFINDLYAGTPSTDRNLYVDSVAANGQTSSTQAVLYSAGPAYFTTPATAATPINPGTVANVGIDMTFIESASSPPELITMSGGSLELTDPAHFQGTLSGQPGVNGIITLDDVLASSLSFVQTSPSAGQLHVFGNAGQQLAALQFIGSYDTDNFSLLSSGSQPAEIHLHVPVS